MGVLDGTLSQSQSSMRGAYRTELRSDAGADPARPKGPSIRRIEDRHWGRRVVTLLVTQTDKSEQVGPESNNNHNSGGKCGPRITAQCPIAPATRRNIAGFHGETLVARLTLKRRHARLL